MKPISTLLIFSFLIIISSCRAITTDTLIIHNNIDDAILKVSLADYLSEVDVVFKDSIKYEIHKYLADTIRSLKRQNIDSVILEGYYFVSMDEYDRFIHVTLFDRVLLNLLKENKIEIIKDHLVYKLEDVEFKVVRNYRFEHIYCGKDWGVFCHNRLLVRFKKSRNRNAYRIIDPF